MKKMKQLIAALGLFLTVGTAHAEFQQLDISAGLVLMTCGQEALGEVAGDGAITQSTPSRWPCRCNGFPYINDGVYYCTAAGLLPLYPITDLSLCPDRVSNGKVIPQDNKCGSRITGTDAWVPQQFFNVSFVDWGCFDHDRCYSNCLERDRKACDDKILQNLTDGCVSGNPYDNDFNWWNVIIRANCVGLARWYYGSIRVYGQSSYDVAQVEACQCGPNNPTGSCNGGEVICLYRGQPGCDNNLNPIYIPNPIQNPPNPFPVFGPGPGIDF